MVCVVCSCCATSPYREVCRAKRGIGSGETLCHDIYPAQPITTVSLATNTYCMMDGLSSCAPRTVVPGSNLACVWTQPFMIGQRIQQEAICYQWFKQRVILSVSKPSISHQSQIKEDTVEPSVPAREFNLKAYAAITWQWSGQPGNPDSPIIVARQRVLQRYQQHHRGRPWLTVKALRIVGHCDYYNQSINQFINILAAQGPNIS